VRFEEGHGQLGVRILCLVFPYRCRLCMGSFPGLDLALVRCRCSFGTVHRKADVCELPRERAARRDGGICRCRLGRRKGPCMLGTILRWRSLLTLAQAYQLAHQRRDGLLHRCRRGIHSFPRAVRALVRCRCSFGTCSIQRVGVAAHVCLSPARV